MSPAFPPSMKWEGYFLAIAQIAVALAGFVGLISVFKRSETGWMLQELAGLRMMLEHTFAALLFGLIPFPLLWMTGDEDRVWTATSVLLASFFVFELAIQSHRAQTLQALGKPPRSPRMLRYFFLYPTFIGALLQAWNAYRWHSVTAYAWGALWLLVPPSVQFFHFLVHHGTRQQRS